MAAEENSAQREDKSRKVWLVTFIVLAILGISLLAAVVTVWFLGFNSVSASETAEDICYTIKQEYTSNSQESLSGLVESFDGAVRNENKVNDYNLETCYVIARDFYMRNNSEDKALYYEKILDEILPKDDRAMEEIMEAEWE